MKKTLIFLFALAVVVGAKAEDVNDEPLVVDSTKRDAHIVYSIEKRKSDGTRMTVRDTVRYSQGLGFDQKRFDKAMREAEERMKYAEKQIKEAERRLEKYRSDTVRWERFEFPKWLDEYGTIDLPKDQKPLIDLSNIKGRWGFEDYYFSGDILHALPRRGGGLYINGWNATSLLPRLSGLLVLKSKKKAAEKVLFSRSTQLRNDRRFQPIVRDRGITIYAHRTEDNRLDEVIILLSRAQSTQSEYVYIVQMMGLLRPDDLTNYRQLLSPGPKAKK